MPIFNPTPLPNLSAYAKLDGSNQPFTGNLNVQKLLPEYRLTETTNSEYTRITKTGSAGDYEAIRYNRVNIPGGPGPALSFGGTTNLVEANATILSGTGAFTITAWIYPTSFGTFPVIAGNYGTGGGNGTGFQFGINGSGVLGIYDGVTGITSGQTISLNTWSFVAVKRSGTTVTFRINGTDYAGGGPSSANISSTLNWVLGRGANYTSERFSGVIDQHSVWNTALSSGSLDTIYNSGTGNPITPTANTLLLWEMTEGSGSTLADTSGNAHTGTITGATWTTGKVLMPATVTEVVVWSSENGLNASEAGIQTFGDIAGRSLIAGTSVYLPQYTTNGFVKTSAGTGLLTIDTTVYPSGSGTTGKIPKWSSSTVLTDSIMSESANVISITSSAFPQLKFVNSSGVTMDMGAGTAGLSFRASNTTVPVTFDDSGAVEDTLRVTAGKVGIRTNNPVNALDITGAYPQIRINDNVSPDFGTVMRIGVGTYGFTVLASNNASPIIIKDAGATDYALSVLPNAVAINSLTTPGSQTFYVKVGSRGSFTLPSASPLLFESNDNAYLDIAIPNTKSAGIRFDVGADTQGFIAYDGVSSGVTVPDALRFGANVTNLGAWNTTGLVVGTLATPVAQLNVNITSSSKVGQIIKGASSQSADLQVFQNSSGTLLSSFDSGGNLGLGVAGNSGWRLRAVGGKIYAAGTGTGNGFTLDSWLISQNTSNNGLTINGGGLGSIQNDGALHWGINTAPSSGSNYFTIAGRSYFQGNGVNTGFTFDNWLFYEDTSNDLVIAQDGWFNVRRSTTPDELVINDAGSDRDFRVEGDTNANLFFLDASLDSIGIGTAAVSTSRLTVLGSGSGTASIGGIGFGSNYVGINLNGSLTTSDFNFLSSPTDTNLYINRPSGSRVQIAEANGSAQFYVASGGKTAINTQSPVTIFNVQAQAAIDRVSLIHEDGVGNAFFLTWYDVTSTHNKWGMGTFADSYTTSSLQNTFSIYQYYDKAEAAVDKYRFFIKDTGTVQISQGQAASTVFANLGGSIFNYFADVGNVGTGEDDLYSSTIPASSLGTNGDSVSAVYQGVFNGAALSTQDLRVYFGGTKIYDSGALSIGVATNNWTVNVTCIRVSSSVVRCSVSLSTDFGTLFPYSTYTEVTGLTLTNTQILKLTGEAAGAGAGDNQIVAKLGKVYWDSAA